jgi:hypothetical protein
VQGVVRHGLLHRGADLGRAAEVAVGRDQTVQRLVAALEVVAVKVQRQPAGAVVEVGEDGSAQKLVPQRLPEAFYLAQRHRMLRPALEVPDAVAAQRPLEFRLSAPGRVLPPVVGQHLGGRAEGGDAALQRLQDQGRALVMGQHVADHEAAVVVQEDRYVQPLVAAQQEGEDIRLPELVWLSPLEATRPLLSHHDGWRRWFNQPLLVQDASDQRLAHPDALLAPELVPDAPRPVLGVRLLGSPDRLALGGVRGWVARTAQREGWARDKRVNAALLPAFHPLAERLDSDAEDPCHLGRRGVSLHRLLDRTEPELDRVGLAHPSVSVSARMPPTCLACLACSTWQASLLSDHLVSPVGCDVSAGRARWC